MARSIVSKTDSVQPTFCCKVAVVHGCLAMSSAVSGLVGAERFILAMVKLQPQARDEIIAIQLNNMLDLLRTNPPQMQDATRFLELLAQDERLFSKEQCRQMAEAIRPVPSQQAKGAAPKGATQEHKTVFMYYPDYVWIVLTADSETLQHKMECLSDFCIEVIGLTNPNENTRRRMMASLHAASGIDPGPTVAYAHMQDFAEIMERKRNFKKGRATYKEFPEEPEEFMRAYPCAYKETDPPVKPRVSLSKILERCGKAITPCRKTNKMVSRAAGITPVAAGTTEHTFDTVLKALRTFMSASNSSSRALGDIPIEMLSEGRRKSLAAIQDVPGGAGLQITDVAGGGHDPAEGDSSGRPNDPIGSGSPGKTGGDSSGRPNDPIGSGSPGGHDPAKNTPLSGIEALKKRVRSAIDNAKEGKTNGSSLKKKPAACNANKRKADPDSDNEGAKKPKDAKCLMREVLLSHTTILKYPEVEKLLADAPVPEDRPKASKKPTHYLNGRIWWSESASCFRLVRRKEDKHDTRLAVGWDDKKRLRYIWGLACATIEECEKLRVG